MTPTGLTLDVKQARAGTLVDCSAERQGRPAIAEIQNAKDACHNSLLGADCSVVNPSGYCSGTSSRPQGKPQISHGQRPVPQFQQ
jgi:hypothetical protein